MNALLHYLQTRRSVKVKKLVEPGPDDTQLRDILTIGMRVPDHGKRTPWRIKVLHEEGQRALGNYCADLFKAQHGEAATAKMLQAERERFMRAPLVLAVLYTPSLGKIPEWEQQLSCGAVCMNLIHGAHARGFGVQWLTEWPAFHHDVCYALGGTLEDKIAGFIYIGTAEEVPEERARPSLEEIAQIWQHP